MKKLLSLLFIPLLFACKKSTPDPELVADFAVTILDEGKVSFRGISANAEEFAWDFGDGKTGSGGNIEHVYDQNRSYRVKLTVRGKGKETVVSQDLTVYNITGNAMFWLKSSESNILGIYVDLNGQTGSTNRFFLAGAPTQCGESATVTFTGLKEGTYNFSGRMQGNPPRKQWSGTIKIVGRQCARQQLDF